jgi:hypothetical protein
MDSPFGSHSHFATSDLLDLLRQANPKRPLSEAQLRYAIRVGRISRPARLGLNLAWNRHDVIALCAEFGLQVPEVLR